MAKENPDRSGASPPSSHPTTLHPAFPKALEPYPARHPALPYELAKPANSPVLLAVGAMTGLRRNSPVSQEEKKERILVLLLFLSPFVKHRQINHGNKINPLHLACALLTSTILLLISCGPELKINSTVSSLLNTTNANPLGSPVFRSRITSTDDTSPYCSK
eukprot:CCRYP_016528-RC/>CCRYP_016528-RC protein AED:0.44 eAED:0.79 QI:0/0/0/1/0/0/2/0/161